ncbi:MAG: hypothetical protein QM500_09850 [Methylococcales bacterium]
MKKMNLIYSLSGAVATSLLAPSITLAADNPFAMQEVSNGIQLAEISKGTEGKCGEGKCGDNKVGTKKMMDKVSEGKCGDKKAATEKNPEGKCGAKS